MSCQGRIQKLEEEHSVKNKVDFFNYFYNIIEFSIINNVVGRSLKYSRDVYN